MNVVGAIRRKVIAKGLLQRKLARMSQRPTPRRLLYQLNLPPCVTPEDYEDEQVAILALRCLVITMNAGMIIMQKPFDLLPTIKDVFPTLFVVKDLVNQRHDVR